MYRPVAISSSTPASVAQFIRSTVDLFFGDVHAMLRLPLPQEGLEAGCNYSGAAVLLAVISGASVVLYDPSVKGDRGRLFKATAAEFYPWDTEPAVGVSDPDQGKLLLYDSFRNPLAHTFGRHVVPYGRTIARFAGNGYDEADLERIETAVDRPSELLQGRPTLVVTPAGPGSGQGLYVEPLYWGVRELIRRLTHDPARMAQAAHYIEHGLV
jgi:hypothetical protein